MKQSHTVCADRRALKEKDLTRSPLSRVVLVGTLASTHRAEAAQYFSPSSAMLSPARRPRDLPTAKGGERGGGRVSTLEWCPLPPPSLSFISTPHMRALMTLAETCTLVWGAPCARHATATQRTSEAHSRTPPRTEEEDGTANDETSHTGHDGGPDGGAAAGGGGGLDRLGRGSNGLRGRSCGAEFRFGFSYWEVIVLACHRGLP